MPYNMKAALAAVSLLASVSLTAGQTVTKGSGTTTRYWDCCKPSCAWPGKGQPKGIVGTCDKNDKPLSDTNAKSGCEDGGVAFMCSSQSPWAVSDSLAYGFAAVAASASNCCQCYQLTFTSTQIKGKKMIVQATNTGNDVGGTSFDIAMPGGGFGQFDGCTKEWGATDAVWGQRYGGPTTNTCPQFPSALQGGCGFRWDWMQGADNPTVDYEVVACPAEIVAKSGCGSSDGASTTPSETTPSGTPSSSASASASASAAAGTTEEGAEGETETETPPTKEGTTNPSPVTEGSTNGETKTEPETENPSAAGGNNSAPSSSPFATGATPSGTAPAGAGQGGLKHQGGKWNGQVNKGKGRYHGRPHTAQKNASPAEGEKGEDCEVKWVKI